MSGTKKVAALDGLRVLAILAIIIYHANATWLPGGYFGVTVFFVLTGYLITLSIERGLSRKGGFDYPRFMLRRIATRTIDNSAGIDELREAARTLLRILCE